MSRTIVLLTDFGGDDAYAGILKGVITSLDPDARVIDLAHGIRPQHIVQGAMILQSSYAYFPAGSIFVCVVDPGVGTSRKILCAQSEKYFFIGPDNGLLALALQRERRVIVRSVENKKYFLSANPSFTFHGRDKMAPVGAHLAKSNGKIFRALGPEVRNFKPCPVPSLKKSGERIEGEIVFFDRFGNGMTNLSRTDASGDFWRDSELSVRDISLGKLTQTYGNSPQFLRGLFNSFGQLEIAVANGSAQKLFSLAEGDPVRAKRL